MERNQLTTKYVAVDVKPDGLSIGPVTLHPNGDVSVCGAVYRGRCTIAYRKGGWRVTRNAISGSPLIINGPGVTRQCFQYSGVFPAWKQKTTVRGSLTGAQCFYRVTAIGPSATYIALLVYLSPKLSLGLLLFLLLYGAKHVKEGLRSLGVSHAAIGESDVVAAEDEVAGEDDLSDSTG